MVTEPSGEPALPANRLTLDIERKRELGFFLVERVLVTQCWSSSVGGRRRDARMFA